MTAGLRLSTLVSRLSAFSGKIMVGKIIAEDVAIHISYRFGISGVIDIILELIASVRASRSAQPRKRSWTEFTEFGKFIGIRKLPSAVLPEEWRA